ncbi:MAG: S8 family serine peptidase [Actinomycetota bacterium]|nr:S8 family serine peptidase [Actinomycetota bacterium]
MLRTAAAALLLALTPSMISLAQPDSSATAEGVVAGDAPNMAKPDLSAPRGSWVPGEVLVRMPERLARRSPSMRTAALGLPGARLAASVPAFGVQVVKLADGMRVETALGRLSARGVRAEPNKLIFADQVVPADDRFGDLWGLHNTGQSHPVADPPPSTARGARDSDIDALEAWEKGTGSPKTVVAVLDSGVDVSHPDLTESLWVNNDPPGGGDDDNNGYQDDVNGWNFPGNNGTLVSDDTGIIGYDHGTHVAGTIAAKLNSAPGPGDVVGVCPGCSVMVLRFMKALDSDGDGSPDVMAGNLKNLLKALAYARSEGADIVNASFGSAQYSPLERAAFKNLGRRGILAVVAAGNDSLDNDLFMAASPAYPASYTLPNVVSVAASNHRDHLAYYTGCATELPRYQCAFTNWGRTSVDLAAPGVDVLSSTPTAGQDYKTFDGTSMAAPHVAGVAGLVKSSHPSWGARAIKNALLNSADRPPDGRLRKLWALPGGRTGSFTLTNGRVNAAAARSGSTKGASPKHDGGIEGAKAIRRRATGRVKWPSDVNDVYKKRLVKGRRYAVSLNGPRGTDFDLWVWRPKTKEIWQLETGCFRRRGFCSLLRAAAEPDKSDATVLFHAKKRAVHYFHVSAWVTNRGRYTLTVKRG